MAPIRVALVGLSASAKVSWASDAHLPYLLSRYGKAHYKLVALLNSSVSAAEAAKKTYNLDSSVKAYGDPAALASDPDVDLVVVNTRVDVHFQIAEPSARAGKALFIEWPLVDTLARTYDLTKTMNLQNSIIGLQGRVSAVPLRLKALIAQGTIGTVLSSDIRAFGNLIPRDAFPEGLTYFGDRKVNGHPINIANGHMLDYVQDVLGELEDFQANMQIQWPERKVLNAAGEAKGTCTNDVPDLLALHGKLRKGKAGIVDGATLSVFFRSGPQFKGDPGFVWHIYGTKGELKVSAPGPYIMADFYAYDAPVTIEVHDFQSDEVRDLGWEVEDWQKELPGKARNIGMLYERYAKWVEGGKGEVKEGKEWPTVGDAVERMEQFAKLYKTFDSEWET
ncbi:NAD(P)-binding protein [Polyplosphaeria fusca]|uniref:NAD(P)-binding protein n=1 Tax=Polyplosphaeria fusca TaxID=682080 RepID=A0A9P4QWL1_9PLEO|nr:NAD(P)-binding protein [Polyplosphaeria fusca]